MMGGQELHLTSMRLTFWNQRRRCDCVIAFIYTAATRAMAKSKNDFRNTQRGRKSCSAPRNRSDEGDCLLAYRRHWFWHWGTGESGVLSFYLLEPLFEPLDCGFTSF